MGLVRKENIEIGSEGFVDVTYKEDCRKMIFLFMRGDDEVWANFQILNKHTLRVFGLNETIDIISAY